MHSFSQDQEDSILNSRLLEASWESFKVAMEPYVLPSVGPSALLETYGHLSEAWENDEGINQEAILRSLNTAFTPTVVKDIIKFIPSENNVTKWGTEVDPKWHTGMAMATGMKPQNININTKVGFALSDVDRQKGANSRKFNAYIGNAKNWSGDYRENIIQQYKEYLDEEKEIARKVKRIFKNGLTLGVDKRNLLDLASSISKSVEATKAGSGKYRASLPRKYVNKVWKNQYPVFYLSKDARRLIANSMKSRGISLDEDNLLQDLNKIAYDLNKDMGE